MSQRIDALRGLVCPVCGENNDDCTEESGEKTVPFPGCLSVCFYCGNPSVFETGTAGRLTLRELSEEEWGELPSEALQLLAKTQRLVQLMNGMRGHCGH